MEATGIKERPIIFGADSVKTILEGRKTQTRRVMKPQPLFVPGHIGSITPHDLDDGSYGWFDEEGNVYRCPYGRVGDRLWGKETWAVHFDYDSTPASTARPLGSEYDLWYKATEMHVGHPVRGTAGAPCDERGRWRSPIHMPRWASRLTLEITDIRAERLQDITRSDIRAEGIWLSTLKSKNAGDSWKRALLNKWISDWNAINAKRGHPWRDNPWVWAITFKRITP